MPIKNIFVLTVLISFSINIIKGEKIRGVEIPRINLQPIIGKWYLLASSKLTDLNICMSCVVQPLAGNDFTIGIAITPKVDTSITSEYILSATMRNDTNVIYTTTTEGQPGPLVVIFSVGYETHIGLYVADNMDSLTNGRRGSVYLIGRDKSLPDGILEEAKESKFYQDGVNQFDGLFGINAVPCVD